MTSHTASRHRSLSTLAFALLLASSPAQARTDPLDTRIELHVHLPAAPARNEAAARRSIATLGRAALVACGGSDTSLAQLKTAVRQSACWHQTMADAVAQVGDPALSTWWAAHPW